MKVKWFENLNDIINYKNLLNFFRRKAQKSSKHLTQQEIYDVLITAKEIFKKRDSIYIGMCHCIHKALQKYGYNECPLEHISKVIPEFNREFLGGCNRPYWWDKSDEESRIKAFDKLIEYYR